MPGHITAQPDSTSRVNKKPRIAGLFIVLAVDLVGSTQVFVDGLMQMPDPTFLIAGENDFASR